MNKREKLFPSDEFLKKQPCGIQDAYFDAVQDLAVPLCECCEQPITGKSFVTVNGINVCSQKCKDIIDKEVNMADKLRYGLLIIGSRDDDTSPLIDTFTTIDDGKIDWVSEIKCNDNLAKRLDQRISGRIMDCRFDVEWVFTPVLLWRDEYRTLQHIDGKFKLGDDLDE